MAVMAQKPSAGPGGRCGGRARAERVHRYARSSRSRASVRSAQILVKGSGCDLKRQLMTPVRND